MTGPAIDIITPSRAEVGNARPMAAERCLISVVIPVYRAERILPMLCERLQAVLRGLTDSYEVIMVCDGSPDRSWEVLTELVPGYCHFTAVRLSRNFGQHYAVTAGLDLCSGEWTVVMDCDLEDRPEEIPHLLEHARSGYDVVIARKIDRQHKWWKRTTSRLFYKVFSVLSGSRLDSEIGNFRIMHRTVTDSVCSMRETYRMFAGLVEWLGFEVGYVRVQHAARPDGRSSYSFLRLLGMAIDGMVSFSNRPLYLSVGLGLLLSLASAGYGAYLILWWFVSDANPVAGWLSTITATSFLGGLILLNQGVLGIYLGRLYNQAKGRPLYVIDKMVSAGGRCEAGGGEQE